MIFYMLPFFFLLNILVYLILQTYLQSYGLFYKMFLHHRSTDVFPETLADLISFENKPIVLLTQSI